jgi:hypothetical protein
MSWFSAIGCFIGQVLLALIIIQIILIIIVSVLVTMGVMAAGVSITPLLPVSGYTLDVSGSDPSKQKPVPNVESAEACSVVAALENAPVAAYIPAMKVCTLFSDAAGLKLTAPADPNMVVLSKVTLPKA